MRGAEEKVCEDATLTCCHDSRVIPDNDQEDEETPSENSDYNDEGTPCSSVAEDGYR